MRSEHIKQESVSRLENTLASWSSTRRYEAPPLLGRGPAAAAQVRIPHMQRRRSLHRASPASRPCSGSAQPQARPATRSRRACRSPPCEKRGAGCRSAGGSGGGTGTAAAAAGGILDRTPPGFSATRAYQVGLRQRQQGSLWHIESDKRALGTSAQAEASGGTRGFRGGLPGDLGIVRMLGSAIDYSLESSRATCPAGQALGFSELRTPANSSADCVRLPGV